MTENKFDWTYFKRRIYIDDCSRVELFKKWATPGGLEEWFIAEAEYRYGDNNIRKPDEVVEVNDSYTWTFHRGSVITGRVLEVKENNLFKFTFGENEPGSGEEVIVTATIGEKNGRCYFDILQENMADSKFGRVNYYISCNMGWMFHMNNLKSIIESGHDLRITGESRMHVDAPSGYPLDNYKWTEFRQIEYIKAPREKVFRSWAAAENIVQWFIAEAEYSFGDTELRRPDELIKPGDKYTWTFHQGITMDGRIVDVREDEYLSFTFGKKEPGSEEDVIVDLYFFSETHSRTRIELYQKNIADTEYGRVQYNLSCMTGWSFFLTNLRSLLESAYDLRETEQGYAEETQEYTLER